MRRRRRPRSAHWQRWRRGGCNPYACAGPVGRGGEMDGWRHEADQAGRCRPALAYNLRPHHMHACSHACSLTHLCACSGRHTSLVEWEQAFADKLRAERGAAAAQCTALVQRYGEEGAQVRQAASAYVGWGGGRWWRRMCGAGKGAGGERCCRCVGELRALDGSECM